MDRRIHAFLAVARAGNLTQAAESIALSQPALTKTIRMLEHEFGGQLFERSRRGMKLTAVGEALLKHAENIELQYRLAHEKTRAVRDGEVSKFSIAAGVVYHSDVALQLIERLAQEFPMTKLRLSFEGPNSALPKLLDGEVDLFLGALIGGAPEGIKSLWLMKIEECAYCSRNHPLANAETIAIADLVDCQWIIPSRTPELNMRLQDFYASHSLPPPNISIEIDAISGVCNVASRSQHLTLLPQVLERDAAKYDLVRLKQLPPIWQFSSGALFRESSESYRIVQRILALIPTLLS